MSVSNSTVLVNTAKCFIYSSVRDNEYAKHLMQCAKQFPKYNIAFSILDESNIPLKNIFSQHMKDNSVFTLSYEYLPLYSKIEDSFLWCRPGYRTILFENKFIAIDVNLEVEEINHLLRILIPPSLKVKLDSIMPLIEIKHHADCSNRKTIYLK